MVALFSSSFGAISHQFRSSNASIGQCNVRYWTSYLFQGSRWTKLHEHKMLMDLLHKMLRLSSCSKCCGHNLTGPHLRFWPLWTLLTDCSPLGWRPLRLRSVVMDPGFVHCHIPTQKIRFISAKQLKIALGINDTLSFLIHREQTRHPIWQQLPHRQMFMQNSVHTAVWYL